MNPEYIDFSSFFPSPKGKSLLAGISLASSGTMNPFDAEGRANREMFFGKLSIPLESLNFCRQVHSRDVFKVAEEQILGREGDGLVTALADRVLTVTAADCMPVFLYDPRNEALGLCHSGWRGTGIALRALQMMSETYGTESGDIIALLGPAIGGCCYEVDAPRARDFAKEWGEVAVRVEDDRYYLDLNAANTALLRRAGVENIEIPCECTQCNNQFASYRREGPENYSRMVAYLGFH